MNKVVMVLVLTTAAASLACMHLASELRDERARSETLETRITELEREVAERDRTASAAPARESPFSPFSTVVQAYDPERPTESTPPASSESSSAEARSGMPPPDVRERMQEHFDRQRQLMQDPKYREAMRKQQRAHMESMYPGLEEALGLSNDERSRFLDLLSQQQMEEMARAQDPMAWDPSDPEAMRKAQEASTQRQQRHQEEIAAQFGSNVRQNWAEYQETLGQRHRVAQMQSQLALAGAPLDAEQSKAVLNALVDEQRRQMQEHTGASTARAQVGFVPYGTVSNATDWAERQERSHERVLSALQSTLASQQLDQLESMFAREREMHRASMELMRAQGAEQVNGFFATDAIAAPVAGLSVSVGPIETREIEDTDEQ